MTSTGPARGRTSLASNAGSFRPTVRSAPDLRLAPPSAVPAPDMAITPNDVAISRDTSPGAPPGQSLVRLRGVARTVLGTIRTNQPTGPRVRDGLTGRATWTPMICGAPLTYADGTPRRYFSRAHAAQSLLREVNGRPDWENAPVTDWKPATYRQWGHTFPVTVDGPLLHGSTRALRPGDILEPDRAPVNFIQSDPFVVSSTTSLRLAHSWSRGVAQRSGVLTTYVYEIEPLGEVALHSSLARGWASESPVTPGNDMRLEVDELRSSAARVVRVVA